MFYDALLFEQDTDGNYCVSHQYLFLTKLIKSLCVINWISIGISWTIFNSGFYTKSNGLPKMIEKSKFLGLELRISR